MTVKKLLDKFQDKGLPTSSVKPSSTITAQQQEQSLDEKKFTVLSKWRGKWGNVSKSRLFSNKKKNHHIIDTSCPSSLIEPTITMSNSTIYQRPYSAIGHVSNFTHAQHHQQQRPTSCTPTTRLPPAPAQRSRQSRLSVPYVVDHLRSTSHCTLDTYSSDDISSFYNAPLSPPPPPPPPRPFTWYLSSLYHSNEEEVHMNDEDTATTDSVPSCWVSKHSNDDSISNKSQSPVSIANQEPTSSPSIMSETLQQYKGDSTSHDDDHPPAAMPCQEILEKRPHYQLATMNVANTMMAMREKQLESLMATLKMKNQQLEQQMADVVSGTWTSTSQLIEENDRLESQIRQLQNQQQQQRRKPSPSFNGTVTGGESLWQDEQEALRHTRAQLGLVEYLEGEPDVMAALNRFKKLLASSC